MNGRLQSSDPLVGQRYVHDDVLPVRELRTIVARLEAGESPESAIGPFPTSVNATLKVRFYFPTVGEKMGPHSSADCLGACNGETHPKTTLCRCCSTQAGTNNKNPATFVSFRAYAHLKECPGLIAALRPDQHKLFLEALFRIDEVEMQKRQEAKVKKGTESAQGSPAPQGGRASATPTIASTSDVTGTQKLAAIGFRPTASPTPAKTVAPSAGLRITVPKAVPKARTVSGSSHTTASPQPTPSSAVQSGLSISNGSSKGSTVPASKATQENKGEATSPSQPKAAAPPRSTDSFATSTLPATLSASTAVVIPIKPPTAPAAMLPSNTPTAPVAPAAMLASRPPAADAVALPAKPPIEPSSTSPTGPSMQKAVDGGQNGKHSAAVTANPTGEPSAATAASSAASAETKKTQPSGQQRLAEQQGSTAQPVKTTTMEKPSVNDSNTESPAHRPIGTRYDPPPASDTAPLSSTGAVSVSSRTLATNAAPGPESNPTSALAAAPARPVSPPNQTAGAVASLQAMFPTMDGITITEVLTAHGGNLDVASNALLEMSDSLGPGTTTGGAAHNAHAQMLADEAMARDLAWEEISPPYTGPASQEAWDGTSPAYAQTAQNHPGSSSWDSEVTYDVPRPPACKPPSPPPRSPRLPHKGASAKGYYERPSNNTPSRDWTAGGSNSHRNDDYRRYDRDRNHNNQRSFEREGYSSRTGRPDTTSSSEPLGNSSMAGSSGLRGLRDWEEPRRTQVERRRTDPPRERLFPKPHARTSDPRRPSRPRSASPPLSRNSAISAAPPATSRRSDDVLFVQRKRNSLPPALPTLSLAQVDALLPMPYQPAQPFTNPLELVKENEQMRPKAALPSFGRSSDRRETAAAGGRGVEREQQSEGTVKKHSPKISDVCGGISSSSSSSGDTSDLLINISAKRSRDGSKKDAQQAGSANALDHDADLSSIHTSLANRGARDRILSSDEPTLKRARTASGRDGEAGQGMTADLSGPAAKLKDTDKAMNMDANHAARAPTEYDDQIIHETNDFCDLFSDIAQFVDSAMATSSSPHTRPDSAVSTQEGEMTYLRATNDTVSADRLETDGQQRDTEKTENRRSSSDMGVGGISDVEASDSSATSEETPVATLIQRQRHRSAVSGHVQIAIKGRARGGTRSSTTPADLGDVSQPVKPTESYQAEQTGASKEAGASRMEDEATVRASPSRSRASTFVSMDLLAAVQETAESAATSKEAVEKTMQVDPQVGRTPLDPSGRINEAVVGPAANNVLPPSPSSATREVIDHTVQSAQAGSQGATAAQRVPRGSALVTPACTSLEARWQPLLERAGITDPMMLPKYINHAQVDSYIEYLQKLFPGEFTVRAAHFTLRKRLQALFTCAGASAKTDTPSCIVPAHYTLTSGEPFPPILSSSAAVLDLLALAGVQDYASLVQLVPHHRAVEDYIDWLQTTYAEQSHLTLLFSIRCTLFSCYDKHPSIGEAGPPSECVAVPLILQAHKGIILEEGATGFPGFANELPREYLDEYVDDLVETHAEYANNPSKAWSLRWCLNRAFDELWSRITRQT